MCGGWVGRTGVGVASEPRILKSGGFFILKVVIIIMSLDDNYECR